MITYADPSKEHSVTSFVFYRRHLLGLSMFSSTHIIWLTDFYRYVRIYIVNGRYENMYSTIEEGRAASKSPH